MQHFDLNLLGALDALLTERNVTRAAERLHVTQPTMSGMLQRLRTQFDDPILIRKGRGLELTPLGSSLIEPVREALRGVEALARIEPVFDPLTSRRVFSIMTSDYCTTVFMPHVVATLAQIAPGVRIEFHTLDAPFDKIVSGEIDLCVTTGDRRPLLGDRPDLFLENEPLFSDEFVCIVASDHVLDEHASLAEHLQYPHVGVKMAGVETIEVLSIRREEPLFKPTYVVESFSLVPSLVAASNAVGVVQRRIAQIAARAYAIRAYPPPYLRPRIEETLYWHPRCTGDPAHVWLRRTLAQEAKRWLADEEAGGLPLERPTQVSGRDVSTRPASAGALRVRA